MIMDLSELGSKIKSKSIELGFDYCGFAKADYLEADEQKLKRWLELGFHSEMSYMEKNFEKRLDPRLLVQNAKSVVSLLINYYQPDCQKETRYKISKYAYGTDYHEVVKNKLYQLMSVIKDEVKGEEIWMRGFVDSAPILDRRWAVKAGHGWIGKNSMLITKNSGSFFFIGEIITSVELPFDDEFVYNYCGKCTACIDACPTNAIVEPGIIDSNLCISFQTIEKKGEMNHEVAMSSGGRIFGCDICQDVCPWNRKATNTAEEEFIMSPVVRNMNDDDWDSLDERTFEILFANSPLKRAGFKKIKSNINMIRCGVKG